MNNIQTGYIDDGALGAMFAGENAAQTEASNLAELEKLFRANQREEQMLPLDTQLKQLSIAPAQYNEAVANAQIANPGYIRFKMAGDMAGNKQKVLDYENANTLSPFVNAAKIRNAETDKQKEDQLYTLNQINSELQSGGGTDENGNIVPHTPMQRMFMENKAKEIISNLGNTPTLFGKLAEIGAQGDIKETIANINAQAGIDRVQKAYEIKDKIPEIAVGLFKAESGTLGRLEAEKAKLLSAEGQAEILAQMAGVPKAQQESQIRQYMQELDRKIAQSKADLATYASQTGIKMPEQAQPSANSQPTGPATKVYNPKTGKIE